MKMIETGKILGNSLVKAYIEGQPEGVKYYSRCIHDKNVFHQQLEYLKTRSYDRTSLVEVLKVYHQQFQVSDKTYEHIEALKDKETFVVISGQQAGLLTGPVYTMYKIITTIQLAREQTERLGVKVVPVFWVAGEDHDYLEVNHVHVKENMSMEKHTYPLLNKKKVMISDIPLDKNKCINWVHGVFSAFGETAYTKDVLGLVECALSEAETFSQFFAQLILMLFREDGLVLIDSGDRMIRQLQIPYLQMIVAREEEIRTSLLYTQKELVSDGYEQMLQIKDTAIHLFYELDGERHLIHRQEDGRYTVNDEMKCFTKDTLLDEIGQYPERFSNNVVTRPLMQEWLFPTLAFVGGPGELAYWGELKGVFGAVDLQMPIIYPRLSFTIVERNVQRYLEQLHIPVEEVLQGEIEQYKKQFLTQGVNVDLDELFMEVKKQIQCIHNQLQNQLKSDFPQCEQYGMKNNERIGKELESYKKIIEREMKLKQAVTLDKVAMIQVSLMPNGIPQERVYNIMYYLNLYGLDFISQLIYYPVSMNFQHKLVKM